MEGPALLDPSRKGTMGCRRWRSPVDMPLLQFHVKGMGMLISLPIEMGQKKVIRLFIYN